MSGDVLDITPDPSVLIALTHTTLKPLDGLSELLDNAIDSFRAGKLVGQPELHPMVQIMVPGEAEVRAGGGVVRVADNGPGLDRVGLESALRAGFSSKNRYDTLGLFGMGFNIATGKLGQTTTVITARRNDSHALRVRLDLTALVQSGSFEIPVEEIAKPEELVHGTWVEVSRWWPEGTPNAGFIVQLAKISKPKLREQLSRRYGTILRSESDDRVRVRLNGEAIGGFEHCHWAPERHVDRQGWGQIPAVFRVDEVIRTMQRCKNDGAFLTPGVERCIECGGGEFKSVEERVHGWVGIQRFDHLDLFGIDLIRNGRAIRVGEKDAFFSFTDDFGQSTREYPVDGQYGRIIGEIHLDHVPVDFSKQDFQRSSEEWTAAITFLRGGPLQPGKWTDGARNESPVSKLFQGYRRVRKYGRDHMYMGRWDSAQRQAVRIGREVEEDYYQRFLRHEEGYYDDARWWELVEGATVPPVERLEECPACGYEGLPGSEVCEGCSAILIGKDCVQCAEHLAASSLSCPSCGASQIPVVIEPWRCLVCKAMNEVEAEKCTLCDSVRGTPDPMSEEALESRAIQLEEYCFESRRFPLADGQLSEPLTVTTFQADRLMPVWGQPRVPSITVKVPGEMRVYVDLSHDVFSKLGLRVPEAIAVETAQFVRDANAHLTLHRSQSVQNIASTILAAVWGESLGAGPEQVADAVQQLFNRVADRLVEDPRAADFYSELDAFETRELADRLISADRLEALAAMRSTGTYLRFCSPGVLAKFFRRHPAGWFGTVWDRSLQRAADVGQEAADNANQQVVGVISRCLDDCVAFLRYRDHDPLILTRVRAAREYLERLLT